MRLCLNQAKQAGESYEMVWDDVRTPCLQHSWHGGLACNAFDMEAVLATILIWTPYYGGRSWTPIGFGWFKSTLLCRILVFVFRYSVNVSLIFGRSLDCGKIYCKSNWTNFKFLLTCVYVVIFCLHQANNAIPVFHFSLPEQEDA